MASLAPGASVVVAVPAGSILRVGIPGGRIRPDDPILWTSDGSGLFRAALSAVARLDGSLLLASEGTRPRLVRIERPLGASGCLDVALFVSRRELPNSFPYQEAVTGCGPTETVYVDGKKLLDSYYSVEARQPVHVTVNGPSRIRFVSRVEYDANESQGNQPFQLQLTTNHGITRTLELRAGPERRKLVQINGRILSLSREVVSYWDVPTGTRSITLESTAKLHLSARSEPWASALPPDLACGPGWLDEGRSIWNLTSDEVGLQLSSRRYPISQQLRVALRSARDQRYRDGGILAWNLLRRTRASYPGHPNVENLVDRIGRAYTMYQPLLPTRVDGPMRLKEFFFSSRRLVLAPNDGACRYLSDHLLEESLRTLSKGWFVDVSSEGSSSYRLPAGYPESQLRLAVDCHALAGGESIEVQIDQGEPVVLKFDGRLRYASEPSQAEVGLSALQQRHPAADAGTLGGPFGATRRNAEKIEVATAQINVPANSNWIRITNRSPSNLPISLQHRQSRRYIVNESQFLHQTWLLPDGSRTLSNILKGKSAPPELNVDDHAALRNHYVPVLELLASDRRNFMRGIEAVPEQLESLPDSLVAPLLREARQHMQHQRWVEALAKWTRLVSIRGRHRSEAVTNRIEVLSRLGETFILDAELRGRLLFDDNAVVRDFAYSSLMDRYVEEGDTLKVRWLISAGLAVDPSPSRWVALAEVLSQQGRWLNSLLVAMAVEPEYRPDELIARLTYHVGWWQSFEQVVPQLTPTRQNFWRGMRLLREGAYDQAADRLADAGNEGEALLDQLESAEQILNGARHENVNRRVEALRQWELWQQSYPGPKYWEVDASIVTSASRVETLVSDPTEVGRQQFRASPTDPVRLTVQGPVNLKIEARLMHAGSDGDRIDDWLMVEAAGRRFIRPVLENRPSSSLTLTTADNQVPGVRAELMISLGPGRHNLRVHAEHHDLLVSPSIQRPTERLPALPLLTPSIVDAVVSGRWGEMTVDCISCLNEDRCSNCIQLYSACAGCQRPSSIPFVRQTCSCETLPITLDAASPVVLARLRLRTGQFTQQDAETLLIGETPGAYNSREYPEILARSANAALSSAPNAAEQVHHWQAMLIQAGRLAEAANLAVGGNPQAAQQQRSILIRHVQLVPGTVTPHAVKLVQLAEQHPHDRDMAKTIDRLLSQGEWKLVRDVNTSAGLVALPQSGPQPPSQRGRLRHALARPVFSLSGEPDLLLSGYRRVTLSVLEQRPVQLELLLQQPQSSFLTEPNLEVELQVDDQPPTRVVIDQRDTAERVSARLSAGQHQLKIRIVNPYLGKYVFVRVFERTADGSLIGWNDRTDGQPPRHYHVALPDQPVELEIIEPSWLRIEEVINGESRIHEIGFDKGGQLLKLRAPAGSSRAMYRIWEFRDGAAKPMPPIFTTPDVNLEPPTRWLPGEQAAAPLSNALVIRGVGSANGAAAARASYLQAIDPLAATALSPADAEIPFVELKDRFNVAGHEDGTWGIGAGWFDRTPLEDSPYFGSAPDRFAQTHLTYEKFNPWSDEYRRTQAVLRFRESSGPSFGVTHRHWLPVSSALRAIWPEKFCCDPGANRYIDRLKADYQLTSYFQKPSDGVFGYDEQLEAALGYQVRFYTSSKITDRFDHISSAMFFGRWLSLEQIHYLPGRVDQDVYTPFRNEHRSGIGLAEMIRYAPTDETYFWVRPALLTNENLNVLEPDNLSLQVGLAALVDNLQFDVAYRFGRYFRDGDRRINVNQHLVYLDAELDQWTHAGSRTTLAFNVRHDLGEAGPTSSLHSRGTYPRGGVFATTSRGKSSFANCANDNISTAGARTSKSSGDPRPQSRPDVVTRPGFKAAQVC